MGEENRKKSRFEAVPDVLYGRNPVGRDQFRDGQQNGRTDVDENL